MSKKQAAARLRVDHLMEKLRQALAACDQGPLRAVVDSDGHAIVQALEGRPLVAGNRIVGVPPYMARTTMGPERRPRDIAVEVR